LLWSISSDEDTAHVAPATSDEWEELAIQAFRYWLSDHASDLNVNVEELFALGSVRTAVHEDGDMIQLSIPRIFRGVPVLGSRATATIKQGNLINVGLEDWGTIPSDFSIEPRLTAQDAYDATAAHVEHRLLRGENNCEAELKILTMTPSSSEHQFGKGYSYALVWRVCPKFEGQGVEAMEGLVDAQSGKIYSFIDQVHYFEAKGGVYPVANDGRSPDGIEQPNWPMPYQYVGSQTTTTGGNYFQDGNVQAFFSGPYVNINDECGSHGLSSSSGVINWGSSGGTDCQTPGMGGNGNTHSSRTIFYELNKMMEIARSHLPSNNWLKQRLTANVNINESCNAYYNGEIIAFYRSGNGCGNTGELASIVDHEWGHGLDHHDLVFGISRPSGEGIADIYGALRLNDSCIGRGFFASGSGCTGVRDIDYLSPSNNGQPRTMSIGYSICNEGVHCLGNVYSEAIWSLYKRTLRAAPFNYDENTSLEIVTRLTFIAAGNVGTWFEGTAPWGGCGSASGYREFLAADDDNGNINDGTPHMTAIYQAFNTQEIACNTLSVVNSGCAGTPQEAPQVTVTSGDTQAVISWSSVAGASNYEVFRTEGVKECSQGKVKLATTTSTSFTDSGLMNGRPYYYIVIPKGPSPSCFGRASSRTVITPAAFTITPSPTKKPSPPPSSSSFNCSNFQTEQECIASGSCRWRPVLQACQAARTKASKRRIGNVG
jgi:Zn-dependent metalloprotease